MGRPSQLAIIRALPLAPSPRFYREANGNHRPVGPNDEDERPSRKIALAVHTRGQLASPCNRCGEAGRARRFMECVTMNGQMQGKCTNCYWALDGLECWWPEGNEDCEGQVSEVEEAQSSDIISLAEDQVTTNGKIKKADTYETIVLAQRPKGEIVPGETFKLKTKERPTKADLEDGQVIVESRYLSLDPAMRGWLNDVRSYVPPVPIGGVMRGAVIGKVIASKSSKFPVGNYVSAIVGWAELGIANEKDLQPIEVPKGARLTDALGCLGITGLTAYFGLLDVGQVKAGDFVVVSGAAGATGSVVCQIAKIKGATVLGIAGSDDKVKWLKELGCDHALNYKDPGFAKKFKALTTGFIDVFFDNVGGEILELALARAKPHARFVICGGFIVFDYAARYGAARAELAQWLAEGKLQRKETVLKGGLAVAEQGLVDLYKGVNTGKLLVEVKADDAERGSKL